MIRRIKVCLNGGRTGAGVPVTPGQLAESAVASVAAGAEAVHMHPRGPDGRESLDATDIGAAVSAFGVSFVLQAATTSTAATRARRFM